MRKQKSKHIDKMVLYLFLVVFFLSATVFAFRYVKYIPCEEVNFSISPKKPKAGQSVIFTDHTKGAQNRKWIIGDSINITDRKKITHVFNSQGDYIVKLIVNGTCEREDVVTIKSVLILRDPTKYPIFVFPESTTVGQKINVIDHTENATSWEWRFGESQRIDSKEKDAEYVYNTPGEKTISLIVNGNENYITKKYINVYPVKKESIKFSPIVEDDYIKDRPYEKDQSKIKDRPSEDDEIKEVPYINEANFKMQIMLISNEKITPQEFTEYFCGDINKTILVNGKNITFLEFCHKIKGKKIKIKNLNLFRDEGSNCIKNVTVEYKKKGLI